MDHNAGMRFSPKPTKSKTYCCVYGCRSRSCNDPTVRFHYFPKPNENFTKFKNASGVYEKVECRKLWKKILKIEKDITRYMQVCSLHFKESDYIQPNCSKKKRFLKKCAVPSCNLPDKERTKRKVTCTVKPNLTTTQIVNNIEISNKSDHDTAPCSNLILLQDIKVEREEAFVDVGIQVTNKDFIRDFCDLLTNESELSTLTGIIDFNLLNTITDIIKLVYPIYAPSKMNVRAKIVMTLMKLKHDVSYEILAVLFKYTSVLNCRESILHMIDVLSSCLQETIIFPDKNKILKNIPLCFKDFQNVRVILNFIEIMIQKPQNLCCQRITFSQNKNSHTIKFMTGVTPAGLISFVSKMYGGSVFNDVIFKQSKISNLLGKDDSIIINTGFQVDKSCDNENLKLIQPSVLSEKKQFCNNEGLLNDQIEKARAYIESFSQRIKAFKILDTRLSFGLAKKGEEIMNIIAAVINLSSPIVKEEKFASSIEYS